MRSRGKRGRNTGGARGHAYGAQEACPVFECDFAAGRAGFRRAYCHLSRERDRLTGFWGEGTARQRSMVSALVVVDGEIAADRLPGESIDPPKRGRERDVSGAVAVEVRGLDKDGHLIDWVEHGRPEASIAMTREEHETGGSGVDCE